MGIGTENSYFVWRTHGGLYALADERIGKLCSLRVDASGEEADSPEPGELYEVVRTPSGQRFHAISPERIAPGMQLHISYRRADWVTTSKLLDVARGTQTDRVLPGVPHIVYTRDRAWALMNGELQAAIPMLARGWEGQAAPLDLSELERPTIVRLDTFRMGSRAGLEWIEDHAPGWLPALSALAAQLRAIDDRITVSDARFETDGLLRVRLAGVPTAQDGRMPEAIERAVLQLTGALKQVCTACGEAAVRTLVFDGASSSTQCLCAAHSPSVDADQLCAEPDPRSSLSPRLTEARLGVEAGWYPLLADLDAQLGAIADYELHSCAQHFGALVVRSEFPDFTEGPKLRRMRELIRSAEHRAEATCEHCGDAGVRQDSPWIHVCCGSCEAAQAHARAAVA